MLFNLTGRTAFITGAASGIGRQSAIELGKCGAQIMISDINEPKLKVVLEELLMNKIDAKYIVTDVTSISSIRAAVAETETVYGGLDILVNSAGILGTMKLEDIDKEKEWNKVLDVDLSGTFFCSQAALPYLKNSPAGRIINIASLTGRNGGFAGSCSYAAAKGGVIAVTRNMAKSLVREHRNITVNVICPGPVWTAIQENYTQEQRDLQLENIPMGRFGDQKEVAAAVCYLASDEAAFTTGATLDINGGAYMA